MCLHCILGTPQRRDPPGEHPFFLAAFVPWVLPGLAFTAVFLGLATGYGLIGPGAGWCTAVLVWILTFGWWIGLAAAAHHIGAKRRAWCRWAEVAGVIHPIHYGHEIRAGTLRIEDVEPLAALAGPVAADALKQKVLQNRFAYCAQNDLPLTILSDDDDDDELGPW